MFQTPLVSIAGPEKHGVVGNLRSVGQTFLSALPATGKQECLPRALHRAKPRVYYEPRFGVLRRFLQSEDYLQLD